jgi:hypothetical protein
MYRISYIVYRGSFVLEPDIRYAIRDTRLTIPGNQENSTFMVSSKLPDEKNDLFRAAIIILFFCFGAKVFTRQFFAFIQAGTGE